MKALFICNQNKHRSKTAEEYFSNSFETKSAGLYNTNPVTSEQLSWADIIFVMEEAQRDEIAKRFPQEYMKKRILVLDVPDVYNYQQPQLVHVLQEQMQMCNNLF